MPYIVDIDQSNKVEDSGDTFLAFSDGITGSIRIPFRVKQAGLQALQAKGKPPKRATLMLFAACVYLLIEEHLDQLQRIVVDNEYDGREADIRSFLFEYIRKKHPRFRIRRILIRSIGKDSGAHDLAWEAFKGKQAVDRSVTEAQLLEVVA